MLQHNTFYTIVDNNYLQRIMYTLTRQNTADKLDISTRSVDRYIKSGKLRSKKEGKIIYIHARDVANLL